MIALIPDLLPSAARPRCARCGAEVKRIPRTWSDHLWPPARATRRYRCLSVWCGWQGRLPQHPSGKVEQPAGPQ